jgi:membrane-bound lytic murein transglycosylase D
MEFWEPPMAQQPESSKYMVARFKGFGRAIASIVLTAISQVSLAYTEDDQSIFPRPPEIQAQMLFWHQVFYRFPSTTTIVHDSDNAANILDLIDHVLLAAKNPDGKVAGFKKRSELNELYLERYRLALRRFHRLGKRALQFGGIEKRVYSVYSRDPAELARLYKGEVILRTQGGLSDEFIRAATRAQDYLPYMEQAFIARGVPARITRLPFVESMFNLKAISKVGASGIWQFMPDTARLYMFVNRFQDERNSPLKASKAAARLLSDNYSALKSWPLAITAYNHGRGGMENAARKVGSRDIGKIVREYRAPSFGFASKNFYSEFLAAARVYDMRLAENRIPHSQGLASMVPVKLDQPISLHQVMTQTNLTKEEMQTLNPCIKDRSFTQNRFQPLPKAYELYLPTDTASKLRLALARTSKTTRIASKNFDRGENR